jgi:hypothetical protein
MRQDAADDLGLLNQRDQAQPPAAAIAREHVEIKTAAHEISRSLTTQARTGVTMVLLESDVAEAFPTGQAVNKALRGVLLAQWKATLANKALQPTSRARKSSGSRRSIRAARG